MDLYFIMYKLQSILFQKTITSKRYINYLKHMGLKIGEGTIIYSPSTVTIDTGRPHLLSIGDYCKITGGVIILSHDYSRSVLRIKYGDLIAEAQKTMIGNNVFIGMNSIILMGSNIGNNVVIGAGSVVSGYVPDNVVVAGNPAKVIMTLDAFYQKRKNRLIDAAAIYYIEFKKHYGKKPTISDMNSFFPLYLKRDVEELKRYNLRTSLGGDNEDDLINYFLNSKSEFKDYDDFEHYCESNFLKKLNNQKFSQQHI